MGVMYVDGYQPCSSTKAWRGGLRFISTITVAPNRRIHSLWTVGALGSASTTQRIPARAAYAAALIPWFPVVEHTTRSNPSWRAIDIETEWKRSLKA